MPGSADTGATFLSGMSGSDAVLDSGSERVGESFALVFVISSDGVDFCVSDGVLDSGCERVGESSAFVFVVSSDGVDFCVSVASCVLVG
jgi:hypothetical protein